MPAKRKQVTPAVRRRQNLKAKAKAQKRTPQSAFDPAAGKDVYEPEKVPTYLLALLQLLTIIAYPEEA